jgi:Tat protein secretion system quality control protein TatD with DNase activity
MLVDTHARLQWKVFDKDIEKVVNGARKADVSYIVNIGYNLSGRKESIKLTERYEGAVCNGRNSSSQG